MPVLAIDRTILALLPPTIFGLFWFGLPALIVILTSLVCCLLTSALMQYLFIKKFVPRKVSVITGILLALTLRPDTPLILVILGAIASETIGRVFVKSLKRNLLNPAITGRFVIAIMETLYPWYPKLNMSQPEVDFFSGATVLFFSEGGVLRPDLTESFLGLVFGSIGETSFLVLLISSFFMLKYVLIKWEGPIVMILLTPILLVLVPVSAEVSGHAPWINNPLLYLFGSSLLLTAIFFLGDPVTTPKTKKGQIVAGTLMAIACATGKISFGFQGLEYLMLLLINWNCEAIDSLFMVKNSVKQNIANPDSEPYHLNGHSPSMQDREDEPFLMYHKIKSQSIQNPWETLIKARLGGRGGSHFPAFLKWKAIKNRPDSVLIINASEGEPGTFKDRFILHHYPHTAAEGILILSHLLNINQIILVVPEDFSDSGSYIINCIQEQGLLNSSMKTSPGAYVAGEETALIRYLMDEPAIPSPKPPLPVESGWYQKPTLVHNLETVSWIPVIINNPLQWGKGRFLVSLSGAIARPGVREAWIGDSVQEILDKESYLNDLEVGAIQIGGVSGAYLPLNQNPILLEQEYLSSLGAFLGTGSIRLLRKGDCLIEDLIQRTRFLEESSCHQCSACRIGTQNQVETLIKLSLGKLSKRETELFEAQIPVMQMLSLCGLGKMAPIPYQSLLRHFPEEVEFHRNGNHIRACLRKNHANQNQSKTGSMPVRRKPLISTAISG